MYIILSIILYTYLVFTIVNTNENKKQLERTTMYSLRSKESIKLTTT